MKTLNVLMLFAALVCVSAQAEEQGTSEQFLACSPRMPDYEDCLHGGHGGGHKGLVDQEQATSEQFRVCSPRMPDYEECLHQR